MERSLVFFDFFYSSIFVVVSPFTFFLPILNFPFIHWFIDEKDIRERFRLTLITAFSMVIGSTAMLLMVRAGLGLGTDMIP